MSTKPQKARITLVGCGKMGGALLRGWVDSHMIESAIVIDPHQASDLFSDNKAIEFLNTPPKSYDKGSDLLIIAVKPQILHESGKEIAKTLPISVPILSIAAGQNLTSLGNIFGSSRPIIRTMPNTPASIGKGMSVCVSNANTSSAQKQLAQMLLETSGKVEWIEEESLMDAVTALSGSGPAYVFYLIEMLEKSGIELGLPPEMARILSRQTVIGSAALAEHDPDIPASVLRENVTSPGGTTEAALRVLMDGRAQNILTEALIAAKQRSKDLNS
ncbi:MAG: pyrroline-5-carboxylate reductase [Alphaproteobacteria bacterium]|nr:pyrroline-5-carboxylate reductase [Alphaproteobacteria bacterium]